MVQPTNRRFVMEDRLDAELATLNTAIDTKVTGPVDNAEIADGAVTSSKIADGTIVEGDLADGAVTSAKILNGTIVDADVNASAAIAYTKVTRPPLSNASDVTLTSPTPGQALTYNGTGWVNSTPVNSLSGLSDVTITSPSGGQVIKYDAGISEWVNGSAAGGVTASATAPTLATAAAGDAWFDTNDGTLYVCYVDPDSTKQWVQVQANSALEGSILARLGSLESSMSSTLPAGSIIQWASNTPPSNWLICDGSAVSRETYASLFAAIGTTYGAGNGSTTFNLPDLRGRVAVGRDGSQSEFDALGETGGEKSVAITQGQLPSNITGTLGIHGSEGGSSLWNAGGVFGSSPTTAQYRPPGGSTGGASSITALQFNLGGSGQAHNNLQPYLVTNYIIKATAGWTAGDSELATRVGALEAAPGRILQVVKAETTASVQTASTTFVSTGLSISVTPKSSNSKLIYFVSQSIGKDADAATTYEARLVRDGNFIANLAIFGGYGWGVYAREYLSANGFVNSDSTSATTFQVQFSRKNGTGTIRSQFDGAGSFITIMEVSN